MLRFSSLWRISAKQFANASQSAHTRKQNFRETKASLQVSRKRAQAQRATFDIQQDVNQRFGMRQNNFAHERRSLQKAAEDLMYSRRHRAEQRSGRAGQHYVTARDRAEEMATARQLLQMQESTRKAMRKGKTERTEWFRAQKQWSR